MEEKNKIIHLEASADDAGVRIDRYLASSELGLSRSFIQKLIKDSRVKVNDDTSKASSRLRAGDRISMNVPPPQVLDANAENIPLKIVYEDKDIVVVEKPAGMVVHPAAGNYSGTLVNALLYHCKNLASIGGVLRPGIVHRLDKDTSGLLVAAKNDLAHRSLSEQIRSREVERKYVALVHGALKREEGVIEARVGRHPVHRKKMAVLDESVGRSREAITYYKGIKWFKNYTLVQLKLMTGRTHQIRVHMSFIGNPIVGDSVYGRKKNEFGVNRQLLHAQTLGFIHPRSGKYMEFKSELPKDFKEILKSLKD